jgi:hypothetical protein
VDYLEFFLSFLYLPEVDTGNTEVSREDGT